MKNLNGFQMDENDFFVQEKIKVENSAGSSIQSDHPDTIVKIETSCNLKSECCTKDFVAKGGKDDWKVGYDGLSEEPLSEDLSRRLEAQNTLQCSSATPDVSSTPGQRNLQHSCMKCKLIYEHKSDLFNHMFSHIDIILKEAEYIRQIKKLENKSQLKTSTVDGCREELVFGLGGNKSEDEWNVCDDDYDYWGDAEDVGNKDNSVDQENVNVRETKVEPDSWGSDRRGKKEKRKHRKSKHKSEKAEEDLRKDKHMQKRRRRGEEARIYECNDCSYKSTELWAMRKHCVIHLPNNPFKCSQCDFCCKTRFSLKSHFSRHTGEKKYKCEHCERSFRTRSIWARHMETHLDKKHTCHVCAKKFYRSDSLRYHLNTHSEQRPYKCHICAYGAKHPKTLKIHLEGHNENKKYGCPTCDFKTSRRSSMRMHCLTHEDVAQFKCDRCSFSCRSWTTLKKHNAVHTSNVRAFSCTECEFIATTERAVMRHLRSHQQDVPIKLLQMKVKTLNREMFS